MTDKGQGIPGEARRSTGQSASEAFYADLEKRFRGAPDEIAKRQSIYLPVLERAKIAHLGGPVLDIGCGRGEWLDLLSQHGYEARGVDLNEGFVLDCRGRGLNVACEEAVQFLRRQPAESYAAVTSFHLVEHLPFGRLIELVAEAHRVLKPGGLVILETPNPENIAVGACSFHFDPTHIAPIPPVLLNFLTEHAGFEFSSIARVNAGCLDTPLAYLQREIPWALQINASIHLLNRYFSIAPDYAVIAQKGSLVGNDIAESPEIRHLCQPEPANTMQFMHKEAEALSRRVQAAQISLQEAEARMVEAKAQAMALENSLSWKVTAPLRAVGRALHAISNPYVIPDFSSDIPCGNRMSHRINGATMADRVSKQSFVHFSNVEFAESPQSLAIQEIGAKAQELEVSAQEMEAKAEWAEQQVLAIMNTFSWRLARPIRELGDILAALQRKR